MTALADRMAIYSVGQATWPEPELGRKCKDCRFFVGHKVKPADRKAGFGRCRFAAGQTLMKKWFSPFHGDSIACPKLEVGE